MPGWPDDGGDHGEKLPRTPQPKDRNDDMKVAIAPFCRVQTTTDNRPDLHDDNFRSSAPVALAPKYRVQWSSPTPVLEARTGSAQNSRVNQSSPSPSGHPPSSSHPTTSPAQYPISSSPIYAPLERDIDIGRVLVRSIRIPNSCDQELSEGGNEDADRVHPAKALFALVMHSYSAGWERRRIREEELGF